MAFHAPVLRSATAELACAALRTAGFAVFGLSGSAPGAASLFGDPAPPRVAYVLGNETAGISPAIAALLTGWVGIPMTGGVESLNVASAAAVVCSSGPASALRGLSESPAPLACPQPAPNTK